MLLLCIHNSFNFEKISDPTGWNVAPKPWQNAHSHSLLLIEWMNWTKSWKFGFISSFIRRISLSLTVHLLIRTITSSFVLQFLSFRYFANPVGIRFWEIALSESPCWCQNTIVCLSNCGILGIFDIFGKRNGNKWWLHFCNRMLATKVRGV